MTSISFLALPVAAALSLSALLAHGAASEHDPAANDLVARGKYLATAGDCAACHTGAGGAPFAGGLALDTPFGALSSPNITPDKATGIGTWTDEQFYRAMHDGKGQHGEFLYPAMPFPWYTNVTREDVLAIKAYLFSLPPVAKPSEKNHLLFPFDIRDSLAAWRAVVFVPGPKKPVPGQSPEVARGAYLVEGLGHCGECHDSRLLAGASKFQKPLQGGKIANWYAPNITSDVHDGIGAWSEDEIARYLKTGGAPGKGIAVGPMAETIKSTSQLTDSDLHAIAAYLKSTPAKESASGGNWGGGGSTALGAQAYVGNCASCHGLDGRGLHGVIPSLAGNPVVLAAGPQNVVDVVLGGLLARHDGSPMLAIGAGMTDEEVAGVSNYVRQSWGNHSAAAASVDMVHGLRGKIDTPMNPAGVQSCAAMAPDAVARAVADPASGLAARIDAVSEANMAQEVPRIVTDVRTKAHGATSADIVNGLTAAYCHVVAGDPKLDREWRALQLGHFSETVYRQVSMDRVAATGR
jgi:mono/diheme cytochrome c family protein